MRLLHVLRACGLALAAGLPATMLGAQANPSAPTKTEARQNNVDSGVVYRSQHADTAQLATYRQFSLDLFRSVARNEREANVFLSPASAAFALSMTASGAAGATWAAMAKTLGVDPQRIGDLGPANASALASLGQQSGVELHVANSVWASEDRHFRPTFLDAVRKWYDAEVTSLVLHGPEARDRINKWVDHATKGKIDGILGDTLPDTAAMVLINAIYFKGLWRGTFDSLQTKLHAFTLGDGRTAQRPLMSRRGDLLYLRDGHVQVLRLPYRSGRIAMYVLLPDSATGLDTLQAQLDTTHWDHWMHALESRDVHVLLPKFHLTYKTSLRTPLEQLGMGVAFDGRRADFSRMIAPGPRGESTLAISDVLQRTFVDVDERGTVAAAATGVIVAVPTAVLRRPPPIEFVVDHPFAFAIRDDRTGLILFLGQVSDPSA